MDLASVTESEIMQRNRADSLQTQFEKSAALASSQAKDLAKITQDLADRTAENEFLEAQVREFDDAKGKLNSAGKRAVAQLEAKGIFASVLDTCRV